MLDDNEFDWNPPLPADSDSDDTFEPGPHTWPPSRRGGMRSIADILGPILAHCGVDPTEIGGEQK